jgi:hypothetical protein
LRPSALFQYIITYPKKKVAKPLHKHKEMLAEVVANSQVVGAKGYFKAALGL